MLRHLSIKNFAIIESIEIDFESGLNIILGETGTGKSILMDSLSVLLGEKALTSYVREGEKKAIIEGIFELPFSNPVRNYLEENDFELNLIEPTKPNSFCIIIRREISISGNSRIFINDSPAQYLTLKTIGDLIIDFHGQFEHLSLINPSNHINILDAYCNNFDLLNQYRSNLKELKSQYIIYLQYIANQDSLKNDLENKQLVLKEIDEINPQIYEDIELERELKLCENSESIHSILLDILSTLKNENSLLDNLSNLKKRLDSLNKYDETISVFSEEINEHIPFFKELASYIENYNENFEFSPQKIEVINSRLYKLNQLIRKYGSIDEILELKKGLENFIGEFSDAGNVRNALETSLKQSISIVLNLAIKLSEIRKQKNTNFENEFISIVKTLGFQYIDFHTLINTKNFVKGFGINNIPELSLNGIDECEFLISTNLGENPKEFAKVASGGELSRIILSLKSLAASDNDLPILVFDEIDSGVSGRIAQKVGELMRSLSRNHQIICITHSPQVAAAGNCVISIEKFQKENRTISTAKKLNHEEIKTEIAKFLSGASVSDSALVAAGELVKNYKN